jgi:hypothetical protein
MDHCFVPGSDDFLDSIRTFLELRGATSPSDATVTNIQRYVRFLNDDASVPRPVGKIYIGAHASPDGWMDIDLDDEVGTPVPHTDIDEVLAAKTSGSIRLKDPTINPDGSTQVRIRGCEVGRSQPFVRLLREAFGNQVQVIAPMFFNGAASFRANEGNALMGTLESFAYAFLIRRKERYRDRKAALADYRAKTATFQFLGGGTVPRGRWDKWLAAAKDPVWTAPGDDLVFGKRRLMVPFGRTIAGNRTWNAGVRTYFHRREFRLGLHPTRPTPATLTEMKALALARLPTFDFFKDDYPVPHYRDFGFATLADFVDGVAWKVDVTDAAKNERDLVAFQFEYTVSPPVLDPATGNLRCNYERDPAFPDEPDFIGVPETDTDFFLTV